MKSILTMAVVIFFWGGGTGPTPEIMGRRSHSWAKRGRFVSRHKRTVKQPDHGQFDISIKILKGKRDGGIISHTLVMI